MELTNKHKDSHSPEKKNTSVVDKTDKSNHLNNNPVIVDDVELNEDQLDTISGGGDLPPTFVR
ncbi:hypothetical protein VB796_18780 [Arcicella sp. LKC2W]|uniref:hypothetical protein n=1 Tax=Arcicella sp. LKC2W TaxID=2984198 RepID=UPI002B1F9D8C|nr:hypothetical protein [Arcicella sp. LKC2W]MEA5461115.1 hypothetical protein [Arcicella sp. LKC2W]